MLFNILNNGCRVEAWQLGRMAQLEPALTLFVAVVCRLTCWMRMGRSGPHRDADLFFDPDDIRSACLLTHTRQPLGPLQRRVTTARTTGRLPRLDNRR